MHLDIVVEDLSDAVVIAEALGASLAEWQPNDDVRVMIDPVGHLFCLFEPYLTWSLTPAHNGTYAALLLYPWVAWGGLTRLHPVCF